MSQFQQPVRNEKGQWVIPPTKRPDGTWRKEIIVKEGYVPQDEIKAFETRASRMKAVPTTIPGMRPKTDAPSVPKKPSTTKSRSSVEEKVGISIVDTVNNLKISDSAALGAVNVSESNVPGNSSATEEISLEKKLKALKKKLRQIEELEQKQTKGEGLSSDQLDKMLKKDEILREIEQTESSISLNPSH